MVITEWHGDFDGGDLHQWDHVAGVEGAIAVVDSQSARQGLTNPYCARISVGPGDKPGGSYGSRAELILNPNDAYGRDGLVTNVAWSHYYDSELFRPSLGHNTLITDLHSTNLAPNAGGGVNINIRTSLSDPDRLELVLMGGRFEGPVPHGTSPRAFAKEQGYTADWSWPINGQAYAVETRRVVDLGAYPKDKWCEYLLQVYATPKSNDRGYVFMYRDGDLLAKLLGVPTTFTTNGVTRRWSLHQGVYRPDEPQGERSTIFLADTHLWTVG